MPFVTVQYGPYLRHGIIDHRLQKINGLFAALDSLGYEIEVVPVNAYNRLSIVMCDREVFRCDIRNLMFNIPAEDDPVCQRAVSAVEEAKERMFSKEHIEQAGSSSTGNGIYDLTPPDFSNKQHFHSAPTSKSDIGDIDLVVRSVSKQLNETAGKHKTEQRVSKVKILDNKEVFLVKKMSDISEESEETGKE